jgi:hypothetical protein
MRGGIMPEKVVHEWTADGMDLRCRFAHEDYVVEWKHKDAKKWLITITYAQVANEIAHIALENMELKSDNARLALRVKELEEKNER